MRCRDLVLLGLCGRAVARAVAHTGKSFQALNIVVPERGDYYVNQALQVTFELDCPYLGQLDVGRGSSKYTATFNVLVPLKRLPNGNLNLTIVPINTGFNTVVYSTSWADILKVTPTTLKVAFNVASNSYTTSKDYPGFPACRKACNAMWRGVAEWSIKSKEWHYDEAQRTGTALCHANGCPQILHYREDCTAY
ncbi:uncharacterized protein L969DRAFT_92100 [Mixia osmundae IAM 14324]|uniref:Uncharacterized protein n=1 Tax=Mixia osmundae (strain CBS 9802 / IAM 14324 / JCM 22182 / KY 12970) TaxID=764103 RepID=G7E565_MIXOS|nr:uncharacterized protein L969DRAFT_92100 [Mixia osmundae IAM 14324]KEI42668.1 hypothetical protein L969DRAFT_92100 [Mixia osmundae IAM 14324]GAA97975.1 hypothetical protein E5Q_04655 [Mixia osmundae IAM 14324]